MHVLAKRQPNRSEAAVLAAAAPSPGLALVNVLASSRKHTREIDVLLCRPSGFAAVEVKGTPMVGKLETSLNGDWLIDGRPADFAGGTNPVQQARTSAASAAGHLARAGLGRQHVAAVVAVSGDVQVQPHRLGDVWVCRADQVPSVLIALPHVQVGIQAAAAAAAAFDRDVDVDVLTAEGFGDQAVAAEESPEPTRAEAKAAARQQSLQGVALALWRSSHRRVVILSCLAVAAVAYYAHNLSWAAALAGGSALCAVAAWQVSRRAKMDGLRMSGPAAVAGWVLTLLPYGLAVAAAVTPWVSGRPSAPDALWLLQFNASTLVALALLLVTRSGKCGFVYPPPTVAQRLNSQGEPTGSYVLVPPEPPTMFGLGLVDPLDPRAKMLGRDERVHPE